MTKLILNIVEKYDDGKIDTSLFIEYNDSLDYYLIVGKRQDNVFYKKQLDGNIKETIIEKTPYSISCKSEDILSVIQNIIYNNRFSVSLYSIAKTQNRQYKEYVYETKLVDTIVEYYDLLLSKPDDVEILMKNLGIIKNCW